MTADPQDQPEQPNWGLVVPFVACESQGGPYEDDSFAAGYHAGQIAQSLRVLAASGGDVYSVTVRTALVRQVELIAMDAGFPVVVVVEVTETEEWPAMPEWSFVTISRGES